MLRIVCPVCGLACHIEEENFRVPHNLTSSYDSDQPSTESVIIYYCEHCDHMFISDRIETSYYEDYRMGAFWGGSFRELRNIQIRRLLLYTSGRSCFLDIGCGIGQYLELAKPHFSFVCGVEPSANCAAVAEKHGFTVMRGYFGDTLLFDCLFDVITLIEVLEHIAEPIEFISNAVKLLADGGVLLVEVPNGQRIRTERLFSNICTDHIHYYSVGSLTRLMQRVGLQVLCAQQSVNENIIEVFARKPTVTAKKFSEIRESKISSLTRSINGKRCAGWGAGAEALSYLGLLNGSLPIVCIFDSDVQKQGRHLFGIPIVKPDAKALKDIDAVVLFANAHQSEISRQLEALSFGGTLIQPLEMD